MAGTILWWPYFSRRVYHRGGDPGCQELEKFDWNIQFIPGKGWDTTSPRGGWGEWIKLMGSQMMLPQRLSDLQETMKYEIQNWWDRNIIPPHRISRGRPDTPLPYHSSRQQVIWARLGQHATWPYRLSSASLRLPTVVGPNKEHIPKEVSVFNRIPQTEGPATGDERKTSPHESYGIRRAVKWILENYEVGPYDWSAREEVVRERVEELWGKPLTFKRHLPQHEQAD